MFRQAIDEKAILFDRIKPQLEPLTDGSSLLVPKSAADAEIRQEWLRYNMKSKIRILCIDDRLFEGFFHCIDNSGNIILTDAQWINAGVDGKQSLAVGQSLYTKKLIQKVYFSALDYPKKL